MIGRKMIPMVFDEDNLEQNDENEPWTLCWAVIRGRLNIVKTLCNRETINQISCDGRTPLWHAAFHKKIEIVDVLLAQDGVDVNAVETDCGSTPLWWAASYGLLEIVKALLKMPNIDVNLADTQGRTPLIASLESCHLGVVNALLEAGADVNMPDNTLMWPLHAVACSRRVEYEIVRQLLRYGANPNVLHVNEYPPLFGSAFYGYTRVALLLIAAGANMYNRRYPHNPVIEGVLGLLCRDFPSPKIYMSADLAALLYVALDDHALSMQSIQRVEDEFGQQERLIALRKQLNDKEIVADLKKRLIAEKLNGIMYELNGQNRIVDVVMAMKPLRLPTLVVLEILMFDNPRLTEIPYHIIWNLVEKVAPKTLSKE